MSDDEEVLLEEIEKCDKRIQENPLDIFNLKRLDNLLEQLEELQNGR